MYLPFDCKWSEISCLNSSSLSILDIFQSPYGDSWSSRVKTKFFAFSRSFLEAQFVDLPSDWTASFDAGIHRPLTEDLAPVYKLRNAIICLKIRSGQPWTVEGWYSFRFFSPTILYGRSMSSTSLRAVNASNSVGGLWFSHDIPTPGWCLCLKDNPVSSSELSRSSNSSSCSKSLSGAISWSWTESVLSKQASIISPSVWTYPESSWCYLYYHSSSTNGLSKIHTFKLASASFSRELLPFPWLISHVPTSSTPWQWHTSIDALFTSETRLICLFDFLLVYKFYGWEWWKDSDPVHLPSSCSYSLYILVLELVQKPLLELSA